MTIAPLGRLLEDIRTLIEGTRRQTVTAINSGLTQLYWRIGQRIRVEVLAGERAAYGKHIVMTLSGQLTRDYGRSFSDKNLRHMVRFAEVFPDEQIVYALSRQLTWTHFRALLYLERPLQRDFYAEMCRVEGWSTRDLRERIDSMLYERTALSKKPDQLIQQELIALRSQDVVTPALLLKDPYVLDFLNLHDRSNTSVNRAKRPRWGLSYARRRTTTRSNCWSLVLPASTLPNT